MARVLLVGPEGKVGGLVNALLRYPEIIEVVLAETIKGAEVYLESGSFDLHIITTFEFGWRKKGSPPGLDLAHTMCRCLEGEPPRIILISDDRADWPEFVRMYPWARRFFVFVMPYDDLWLETEACRLLGIESRDYGLEEDESDHSILVPPWTEQDAIDFAHNSASF